MYGAEASTSLCVRDKAELVEEEILAPSCLSCRSIFCLACIRPSPGPFLPRVDPPPPLHLPKDSLLAPPIIHQSSINHSARDVLYSTVTCTYTSTSNTPTHDPGAGTGTGSVQCHPMEEELLLLLLLHLIQSTSECSP